MKLSDYKGFEIHLPTSGGKAGKGYAVTTSIQVRKDSCIKALFRFKVHDWVERRAAMKKAREFCDANLNTCFP